MSNILDIVVPCYKMCIRDSYTDEDKVDMDGKTHFQPHFKPDINIDLLRSNNYITHFTMMRKTLLEKAGMIREEYDGAQDYDLFLRLSLIHILTARWRFCFRVGEIRLSREIPTTIRI